MYIPTHTHILIIIIQAYANYIDNYCICTYNIPCVHACARVCVEETTVVWPLAEMPDHRIQKQILRKK